MDLLGEEIGSSWMSSRYSFDASYSSYSGLRLYQYSRSIEVGIAWTNTHEKKTWTLRLIPTAHPTLGVRLGHQLPARARVPSGSGTVPAGDMLSLVVPNRRFFFSAEFNTVKCIEKKTHIIIVTKYTLQPSRS